MGHTLYKRAFAKKSRKAGNSGSAGTIKAKKLLRELEKKDGTARNKKK